MGDSLAEQPTFTIRQDAAGPGRLSLRLSGSLSDGGAELLACWVDLTCRPEVRDIRLDLTGLVSADPCGARSLAAAYGRLCSYGRQVDVVGMRPQIEQILRPAGPASDEQTSTGPRDGATRATPPPAGNAAGRKRGRVVTPAGGRGRDRPPPGTLRRDRS